MIHFVFYTERFVRKGMGGIVFGPFIFIRPKYRNDVGLLEHEKVHVWQFWRTWGMYLILYNLSKTWRLWWEVEGYKEQMKHSVVDRSYLYANFIALKYRIPVSVEEARRLLNQ